MNMHAEMTDAADAAARTVEHVAPAQFDGPTPCTKEVMVVPLSQSCFPVAPSSA